MKTLIITLILLCSAFFAISSDSVPYPSGQLEEYYEANGFDVIAKYVNEEGELVTGYTHLKYDMLVFIAAKDGNTRILIDDTIEEVVDQNLISLSRKAILGF